MFSDTIIAPASGSGRAGVCVIRVSGPQAKAVIQSLTGRLPLPRLARLLALRDGDGEMIDRALVLWFPGPGSFTGEDVVEFHVHGGAAVVQAVLNACLVVPQVRLARPGEFTRRAFENGKMDLSSAEGLADLIDAETEAQRRQALRQMDGALQHEVENWRDGIIGALADAEGDIDFPDEDLPPGLSAHARDAILELRERISVHLLKSDAAQRVRDGFKIAIIGAPNAGKSSLLNVLAQREAAIVSDIPGTTRDVVEVRLVLGGAVIWLADTAGLREAADTIEAEGVRRALERAETADLRIGLYVDAPERAALAQFMEPNDIWVRSKADTEGVPPIEASDVLVSAHSGRGVDDLEGLLRARASADLNESEIAPLTRARHREAAQMACLALDRALEASGLGAELVAEDLRLAARHLGRIVGKVDVDDVLDRVFSQFCIGK